MGRREIARLTFLTVLIFSVGCGEKVDYKERFLKLQAQSQKEIAELKAKHVEQADSYELKLRRYEREVSALKKGLGAAEEHVGEAKGDSVASAGVIEGGEKEGLKEEVVQPAGEPGAGVDTVGSAQPAREEIEYLLEYFMKNHESNIEDGMREEYIKDFSDYIADLRGESTDEPVLQKKENMLVSLRERMDQETDAREIGLLENRIEKIESAGEDELEGILDYYQRLENFHSLNNLMEKYNIAREELVASGIAPPPRSSWGPDAKEVAFNLNNFVQHYEPLTEEGQRDQYRKDFNDYISNLTKRETDEEVLQEKDQMLADLEGRYKTASDRERIWLERRMRRLESSDMDSLRRTIQFDKLRQLGQLAERYGIPSSELRQSGIWISRRRRSRY